MSLLVSIRLALLESSGARASGLESMLTRHEPRGVVSIHSFKLSWIASAIVFPSDVSSDSGSHVNECLDSAYFGII